MRAAIFAFVIMLGLFGACAGSNGSASVKPAADSTSVLSQGKALTHEAEQAYAAKNVDRMIRFYQQAIDNSLAEVSKRSSTASEDAEVTDLLHLAKDASFNLGANTWPGWNEAGIVLSPQHLAAGRKAAELNLELAQRLRRGPDKLSIAHWLIGAHAMANGELDEAMASFNESKRLGEESGFSDLVRLTEGYILLTKVLQGEPHAQVGLDETIQHFEALVPVNDSAGLYASQLRSASAVFGKR